MYRECRFVATLAALCGGLLALMLSLTDDARPSVRPVFFGGLMGIIGFALVGLVSNLAALVIQDREWRATLK